MKRVIICLLVGAFLLAGSQGRPEPPKTTFVECFVALCVLGTGAYAIYTIWRLCRKLPPLDTNGIPIYPPAVPTNNPASTNRLALVGAGYGDQYTVQTSWTVNAGWQEGYTLTFSESPGAVTVVASKAGVPVLTNTAPLVFTNGDWQTVLDLGALNLTNQGTFFRIVQ